MELRWFPVDKQRLGMISSSYDLYVCGRVKVSHELHSITSSLDTPDQIPSLGNW